MKTARLETVFNVQVIPLAYNRAYVIDSDGLRVLVDAGPDYEGAWDALRAAMTGRLPDIVIVTHGHNDHAGLGRRWQKAGVAVALDEPDHHLTTEARLSDPREWAMFERYLSLSGAPKELQTELLATLARRQAAAAIAAREDGYQPASAGLRWPTEIRMLPFEPNRIETIEAATAHAGVEVIRCPGHTPGNVVVAVPSEGVLFSGDQLLPDITPTPGIQAEPADGEGPLPRFPSLPRFVDSLRALRQRPWTRCYPGHGEPFDDPAGRIDENLGGIEERSEKVRMTVHQLGTASAYEIAKALYPRALARRFWQIVATVQGNLDLLVAAGELKERDGIYSAA